ncbi:unnamed protein product [Lupinus luteus]|uniref:Uncharacterized protein n=1 Tax=Lupinus luteus TaxID=3873 RepID=A0AAV1XI33_LUPLU
MMVLTLLQEIAQYLDSKIDRNELVRKTTTGISNAREYQMLWRHLAYHDPLTENPGDTGEPLDDNSDVEYELEVLPPISVDSASEATTCVQVMIASHLPSIPTSSTIEASLTVNIPVCHSSRTPNESSDPSNLLQGWSIIFPITFQRTTLPTVSSTKGIEIMGTIGGNMVSKRKRWAEEEENKKRAIVQRWREWNWTTMERERFYCKENWRTIASSHETNIALTCALSGKFAAPKMTNPASISFNKSVNSFVQPCNIVEDPIGTNSVSSRCTPTVQKAINDALQQATNKALTCALGEKFAAYGMTNHASISFNKSVNSSLQPCNIVEAPIVLTLHQEIAQYPGSKIDLKELVMKTTTGISNAKEYQMLWRHLAYRDPLPLNPGDTEEPLDDNSDVQYELEALPPISVDSASEATTCVKVMMASRMTCIPSSSTIEA